jgi:hypothetical protein
VLLPSVTARVINTTGLKTVFISEIALTLRTKWMKSPKDEGLLFFHPYCIPVKSKQHSFLNEVFKISFFRLKAMNVGRLTFAQIFSC